MKENFEVFFWSRSDRFFEGFSNKFEEILRILEYFLKDNFEVFVRQRSGGFFWRFSKTFLKRGKQKFSNIINEYTKYDPTLPRVKNIPCPNEHCDEDDEKEIIYIRYDDTHMKYVYLCNACDTTWTMDNIN